MRLGLALLLTLLLAGCASAPPQAPPKPFPPVTITFPGEHHRVEINMSAQPGVMACTSRCYSVAGALPASAAFGIASVADRVRLLVTFPPQPLAVQLVVTDTCTPKPTILQGSNAYAIQEPGDRPLCHDMRIEARQPLADAPPARVDDEQAFPIDVALEWWIPPSQIEA